jgi:transposase
VNTAIPRSRRWGDRRSARIEAHGATILAMLEETADTTLEELRRQLAEKGLVFGDATVCRFLERHKITRKKDRPAPQPPWRRFFDKPSESKRFSRDS